MSEMKYGVMSTRNLSGAESPSRSSSVRLRICSISASSLTRLDSCQRQSFHFSSGTSAHSGARRLAAGRPSAPSRRAGSRWLTNGVSWPTASFHDSCIATPHRQRLHIPYAVWIKRDHSVQLCASPPVRARAGPADRSALIDSPPMTLARLSKIGIILCLLLTPRRRRVAVRGLRAADPASVGTVRLDLPVAALMSADHPASSRSFRRSATRAGCARSSAPTAAGCS